MDLRNVFRLDYFSEPGSAIVFDGWDIQGKKMCFRVKLTIQILLEKQRSIITKNLVMPKTFEVF